MQRAKLVPLPRILPSHGGRPPNDDPRLEAARAMKYRAQLPHSGRDQVCEGGSRERMGGILRGHRE